jgi:hypothetical protein
VCARVGNQRCRGVVTAWVRMDAVRSLRHQCRDPHQSTYPVPLRSSGLILLSEDVGVLLEAGASPEKYLTAANLRPSRLPVDCLLWPIFATVSGQNKLLS